MARISCFSLLFFIFSQASFAQVKEKTHVNQVWLAYLNQTRLSKHFGTWTDLHLRTKEDFFSNFSTSIIRVGLTYYAADNTRLTAGYAFVSHYPGDNHKQITQPEHRPWQQVQWNTRYSALRTVQTLRLEERYRRKIASDTELADGYHFNYKLRYNFQVSAPLGKHAFQPGSFSFVLNDEVHVNFGKEIVNNYFDQNRFFAGFGYQVNKTDNLQFGFMSVFQQLAAGNRYRTINGPRIFYFQNLDLRKKE